MSRIGVGLVAAALLLYLAVGGWLPPVETELTPSGRIARKDADALVARYTAEAEAAPTDWRARYRLGVVQDAAGRRKDARASIRRAISLSRA